MLRPSSRALMLKAASAFSCSRSNINLDQTVFGLSPLHQFYSYSAILGERSVDKCFLLSHKKAHPVKRTCTLCILTSTLGARPQSTTARTWSGPTQTWSAPPWHWLARHSKLLLSEDIEMLRRNSEVTVQASKGQGWIYWRKEHWILWASLRHSAPRWNLPVQNAMYMPCSFFDTKSVWIWGRNREGQEERGEHTEKGSQDCGNLTPLQPRITMNNYSETWLAFRNHVCPALSSWGFGWLMDLRLHFKTKWPQHLSRLTGRFDGSYQ